MTDPGPPADIPAVEVGDLRKAYGGRRVVDGISFSIAPGEVFGIVGPNGAGKTTTVEILEGYRTPDSGRVRVLGFDPRRQGAELRRHLGVMLQEGGLYPGIRAVEAIRLFAAYYDDPVPPDDLLDTVGLRPVATTPVRRLSGGERQRLSLALAIVGRPRIAFLDEPTAGMDPRARASTWEVIRTLRAEAATVVLTTHAMEEAEALADRLAVMDRGRLVALGTPAELTAGAGADTRFTATAGLDCADLARALALPVDAVREERPGEYVVDTEGSPDVVAALAAWLADRGVPLGDLRAGRRSLDEVFLRLTSEPSTAEERW